MEQGGCDLYCYIKNPVGDFLREFIFQQEDVEKPELNLAEPGEYGIKTQSVQHVFINSGCGRLGAWFLQSEKKQQNKVILYCHGVKGTRGRSYRVELYNVLLDQGYSILTIDYRGFGDSSDASENEDTVVEDARSALSWVRAHCGDSEILVWGHSMGTGVVSRALAEEFREHGAETGVCGLVLEAPYNNFTDEFMHVTTDMADNHPALVNLYSVTGTTMPSVLLNMLNMEFNSDQWIASIPCPVLILHAHGDQTIPIELGRKLSTAARDSGNQNVEFVEFDHSYGHRSDDTHDS